MGWSPPCRETSMIWPLKVLTWVSEFKDQISVIFGLRHLISEFLPKMASTQWDEVAHAEKPWWFDLWRSKLEFLRSKTKLVLSLASVIWFQNFGPKWPQPNGMKSPMQRNLDDLTSEGLNLSFWVQTPNWCYLWPPSFDFRIFAENGLNPMGWSPPCRETSMIWPLKV